MRKGIFFDRDGTINEDLGYIYKYQDWIWKKNALEALRKFKLSGYLLFVITNQSGIARGFYSERDVLKLHLSIDNELFNLNGFRFDEYLFCPHHPDFGEKIVCSCRKPRNGMIEKLISQYSIDRSLSWMLGDKITDITAGLKSKLNVGLISKHKKSINCHNFKDLLEAFNYIKRN